MKIVETVMFLRRGKSFYPLENDWKCVFRRLVCNVIETIKVYLALERRVLELLGSRARQFR